MKPQKTAIILVAGLVFLAWSVQAKQILISKDEVKKTIECQGDEVLVRSNECELRILGQCLKLTVEGNENSITIQWADVVDLSGNENTVYVKATDKIDALGNNNHVVWEGGIKLKKPTISSLGSENKIEKGAVDMEALAGEEKTQAPKSSTADSLQQAADVLQQLKGEKKTSGTPTTEASGQIVINQNNLIKTIRCNGEDVIINGNLNNLEVTGICRKLKVNGNSNLVRIEAVGAIETLGTGNNVFWQRGLNDQNPAISNLGSANKISQKDE